MIIAKLKKQENIAEYILYMWQIEDLIRAYNLDGNEINNHIVAKYNQPEPIKKDIKDWYDGLIDLMKEEKIEKTGHLQFMRNTVNDLNELHLELIKLPEQMDYIEAYGKAKQGVDELLDKSKGSVENEVEACFNGLYGLLMLRFKKESISPETVSAMSTISHLIALLSHKYKLNEQGKLEL